MEHPRNDVKRIYGGDETQIFTGVGPHTIVGNNRRGFAITCRVTGTIIAAMTAQDEGQFAAGIAATAYAPTGWIGAGLYAGETLVANRPIVTITLTAATDSIQVHTDRPY